MTFVDDLITFWLNWVKGQGRSEIKSSYSGEMHSIIPTYGGIMATVNES